MGDQFPLEEITASILHRIISVQNWGDASFINMPMAYPSGAFVTVRLSWVEGGLRVSDTGFAYREADSFGAGRSFRKTAQSVAEDLGVSVGKRSIFVDVQRHEIERAVLDVSAASFTVAERIVARASSDASVEVIEALRVKLNHLFHDRVSYGEKVVGASATEWDVSAVASLNGRKAVFQAVSNYPVAIYKASTAFHDLAALDNPPALVSVVANKQEMGHNLSLLAQAGRVIEVGQSDDVFLRSVA
ncbi:MAG TPA: hypothetical protein ENK34_10900 [Rhodobacteraceae bacterium]|nr:hypothetical protein [Paracoccaceae bacterium]